MDAQTAVAIFPTVLLLPCALKLFSLLVTARRI
jgi:hypothetical protein